MTQRIEYGGHIFEGDFTEDEDGTFSFKGEAICGPHGPNGEHEES